MPLDAARWSRILKLPQIGTGDWIDLFQESSSEIYYYHAVTLYAMSWSRDRKYRKRPQIFCKNRSCVYSSALKLLHITNITVCCLLVSVIWSLDIFSCYPEQVVEWTVELPVVWDAMFLIWRQGKAFWLIGRFQTTSTIGVQSVSVCFPAYQYLESNFARCHGHLCIHDVIIQYYSDVVYI